MHESGRLARINNAALETEEACHLNGHLCRAKFLFGTIQDDFARVLEFTASICVAGESCVLLCHARLNTDQFVYGDRSLRACTRSQCTVTCYGRRYNGNVCVQRYIDSLQRSHLTRF